MRVVGTIHFNISTGYTRKLTSCEVDVCDLGREAMILSRRSNLAAVKLAARPTKSFP